MCGKLQMGIVWVHWNEIPEASVVSAHFDKQSESAPSVDQIVFTLFLCLAFIASKRCQMDLFWGHLHLCRHVLSTTVGKAFGLSLLPLCALSGTVDVPLITVPVFKSRCTGARKRLILATGGLLQTHPNRR